MGDDAIQNHTSALFRFLLVEHKYFSAAFIVWASCWRFPFLLPLLIEWSALSSVQVAKQSTRLIEAINLSPIKRASCSSRLSRALPAHVWLGEPQARCPGFSREHKEQPSILSESRELRAGEFCLKGTLGTGPVKVLNETNARADTYEREQHLENTLTPPGKRVSAKGHEIRGGSSASDHGRPYSQMELHQHGHKEGRSLTVRVNFLLRDSLLSFVFLKLGKCCPVSVLPFMIKHAIVAFISSKREGRPREVVNHSLIVP